MPKNKSLRTAFIRVHCTNNTEKGVVEYSESDMMEKVQSFSEAYLNTEFAFILHNRDKDPDGKLKAPHFHIVFRFKNPVPFDAVKKVFPYGEIKPAGSINAAVQYLCHKNSPEKTAYEYGEIKTNMNESVIEKLFTEISDCRKGDKVLEQIVSKIASGEIREYNRFDYIDDYSLVKYDRQIKIAFRNRSEKVMRDPNRNIEVYFLCGNSGVGKTSFAKRLASTFGDGSYYVSGSKNDSLQDYKGQNTLILDELRDTAFDLDDLLKVLDNHTASSIKSRFFNKTFLGEVIIITSSAPIENWYPYTQEDRGQFYRRITSYWIMEEESVSIYQPEPSGNDSESYKFVLQMTIFNPVTIEKRIKDEAKRGRCSGALGAVAASLDSFEIPEEVNKKLKKELMEKQAAFETKQEEDKKKPEELKVLGEPLSLEDALLDPDRKYMAEQMKTIEGAE